MEYKGVEFLRGRKYEDWDSFHRGIDWVEGRGLLVPATVVFKPRLASKPQVDGYFRPKYGRIYLYRAEPKVMELTLVHELVHAFQCRGGTWEGGISIHKSGKTRRGKYLLDPMEVEAYYYTNLYSLEVYGEEIPEAVEYRNLGVDIFRV